MQRTNVMLLITRTLLLLLLTAASFVPSVNAQGGCFSIRLGTVDADPGDTVAVEIRANGFTNLLSYAFTLEWEPSQLQYLQYDLTGSVVFDQLFNPFAAGQGIFRTIWYDETLSGKTLPDNSLVFTLKFKVIATGPGFYPVKINPDKDPTYYEFYDKYSHYFPLSNIVGGVRIGPSEGLSIDNLCVTIPDCIGNFGSIQAAVSGGMEPYTFHWAGPNNYVSDKISIDQLNPGRYELTVTDAAGAEARALVRFYSGYSNLNASVTTQKATCNAANGCAGIYPSGGLPPYQIQWNEPGSDTAYRCDLKAGEYSVTITDSKGCIVEKPITITKDSLISVTLSPTHADCRFDTPGNIQLQNTGAAPFEYHWSNGAESRNLENLSIGVYSVTVTDALGCRGTSSIQVKDYGTFDWEFYTNQYCTYQKNQIDIKGYALAQRAVPPLSITWDNGTRQEVETLDEAQLYQIVGSQGGLLPARYSVTVSDAEGCSVVRDIDNQCGSYLPEQLYTYTPKFFITYDNQSGTISVNSDDLLHITSIHFSLVWDNSKIQLNGIDYQDTELSGLKDEHFTRYPNTGRLDFHWESPYPGGAYNPFKSPLFHLKFNGSGFGYVDFKGFPDAPIALIAYFYGPQPFIGRGGAAYFFTPSSSSIPEFSISRPECANNGYARINLTKQYYDLALYHSIAVNHHPPTNARTLLPATDFLYAKPGYMEFYTSASGSYTVDIPPYNPFPERCFWPGDADQNGVVNHFDLLYLGLGMVEKNTGLNQAPRLYSNTWFGKEREDWQEQTPKRKIDFKNLDIDTNGQIEAMDTIVLMKHWSERINHFNGPQLGAFPTIPDSLNTSTQIIIDPFSDTLTANFLARIPLRLEATDVLGLGFSISYNPAFLQDSVIYFEPAESWLGDPESNMIQVQKNIPKQSRLDIALTRTDHYNASGNGIIGYLRGRFKLPNVADTIRNTALFVTNTLTMNTEETFVQLGEFRKGISLVKAAAPLSAALEAGAPPLLLSPNPVSQWLRMESEDMPMQRVLVYRSDAEQLLEFTPERPEKTLKMDVSALPDGVYFAKIYGEQGVVVRPFVVMR